MFKSKEHLISAVKIFGDMQRIPLYSICMGGGGALMLMGARETTQDLNLWVDEPHFSRLAAEQGVTNHPMDDTVIPMHFQPAEGYVLTHPYPVYVRQRNRYFEHVEQDGLNIFDPLTLLIHKRRGYIEPARPAAKRQQDYEDIKFLNDLLAVVNKVRDVA